MKQIGYGLIIEDYLWDQGVRRAYGIACYDLTVGNACVLSSVCDISSDRRAVESLAELCDRMELAPEHLKNVVEDMLAKASI